MDAFQVSENLQIQRHGLQSHDYVLDQFRRHDVFCLPTHHSGEGHNNSVNEAMMLGLSILVTRHGFLGSVLDAQTAVFLDGDVPTSIASALGHFAQDRTAAAKLGLNAYRKLVAEYTSDALFPRLEGYYREMTAGKGHSAEVQRHPKGRRD